MQRFIDCLFFSIKSVADAKAVLILKYFEDSFPVFEFWLRQRVLN